MSLSSQKGVFDRQVEVNFMVLNIFASNLQIMREQDTNRNSEKSRKHLL